MNGTDEREFSRALLFSQFALMETDRRQVMSIDAGSRIARGI